MNARDRFPAVAHLAALPAWAYGEAARLLDALDRAEADADRLAACLSRLTVIAEDEELEALRLHDEAVARR